MSRSGFATIIQFTSGPCAAVNGSQGSDGIEASRVRPLTKRSSQRKETVSITKAFVFRTARRLAETVTVIRVNFALDAKTAERFLKFLWRKSECKTLIEFMARL